ncbi:hypothetical protein AB4298_12710 [Shewanella sp. 10N.261.52.F9]|uniref:hypothetical protein n=1 Tax=Shewanella sp. 10N.261.52.F9 TaxID=3229684 RepID=UPI00354F977F
MRTLLEFAEFASKESRRTADRSFATGFRQYCKEYYAGVGALPLNQVGDIEFLHYHAHLVGSGKSHKMIYAIMVALRRLMTHAHNDGHEFAIHPRYFSAPPKPSPDHFNPLSSEQLAKLEAFLKRDIETIYKREATFKQALKHGQPIRETGASFKETPTYKAPLSFWKWQIPLKDCILLYHKESPKYPNNTTLEQLSDGGEYASLRKVDYDLMNTPFKLAYKRMGVQRLKHIKPFLSDAPDLNNIDVIGIIYPRIFEVHTLIWAICLETGWSQDMVERIDFNDYLYSPIPMESDVVFIKTMKQKGINGSNGINEAKQYIHPSSKSNPFSAYNLIQLFIERASRLRHGRNYEKQIQDIGTEPFFIYYNENRGLPILAHHPDHTCVRGATTKKSIMEKELGFRFDGRQLRPTCLYLREKNQNLPLLLQVALFGHSSSAVTDEFYKDTALFQQIRKDKLAVELNEIQKSIHNGSFKGTMAPLKQKKQIQDKIITIFTEHSGESPLAVCNDNRNPDWPGFEVELRTSSVCRRFNKCLLCSRSTIYSDNIPFVVDRYLYFEQQSRKLRKDVFERLYGNEYLAAKEVIESWPYPEDIEEAEERTIMDDYLLPPIISESFQ